MSFGTTAAKKSEHVLLQKSARRRRASVALRLAGHGRGRVDAEDLPAAIGSLHRDHEERVDHLCVCDAKALHFITVRIFSNKLFSITD